MKKALSMLLAIVMVISMMPASVFAADLQGGKITFTTTFTEDMSVGDTFTVTATLSDNPGIASFTNQLKWNKDVLNLVRFETEYDEDLEEDVFKSDFPFEWVYEASTGVATFARAKNTTKNGDLYTAVFEIVSEDGELGLGLTTTEHGQEFTFANAAGDDIDPTLDFSAISGLTVGGKPVGPEMPEDAPFTAITTDAGAILAIEQQEDVNDVPYYIVTIPADATTAYVTAPDQVVMQDYDTGEMQATAYAFNVENYWEPLFISYNYEDSDDGPIVEIPMNMVASDWSGEVELCFVEDEDGYLTHAFGIEDANYACLGLISFRYGEADEGGEDEEPTYSITVEQTTGGTVTVYNEAGEEITEAAEGEYVLVQVDVAAGYKFKHVTVNGEPTNLENGFFKMPAGDVTVSAVFEAVHTCDYNQETADAKYLKSEATCQSGAVYYKSCTCGEFDNSENAATFTSGESVPCNYVDGECKWCGAPEVVIPPNPITNIEINHPNIVEDEDGNMTMDMVVGADEKIDMSFALTDTALAPSQIVMWFSSDETVATVDQNGKVTALKAGQVTITAKAVEANGVALLADGDEVLASITLNVADPNPGYTVNMGQDVSTNVGQTIQIPVVIGHTDAAVLVYNCYELVFQYDPAVLKLLTQSATAVGKDFTVVVDGDTITVRRYGADLNVGDVAFTLQFEVISGGDTNVKLISAKVGESETAHQMEAPVASVIDNITLIHVAAYMVTLPEDFQGESFVNPGEDYEFAVKDPNYDYTVKATINGVEIDVTDNGDGTYTIAADNITGNIVITTTKTGKTVNVTVGTDMTGNDQAQYMTDYTANLTKVPGFGYTIAVTIGGQPYTNYTYDETTGEITIPGADITGDIVFTITKVAGDFTVTFTGNCAGHATGNPVATGGQSYSFTLTKRVGYTYSVTATMGGESVNLTETDGTYTIAVVTGDIVITVTGESDLTVEVTEFVKLDGKSVFLITANQTLAEGEALVYDGTVMFYSNQYNAWCCLVITDTTLTVADAKEKITSGTVAYTTLEQTYDVNGAGEVDINDAQLVFDMYNNEYQDFELVTMQKFLNADVNGDKKIDVNDAAAIVAAIINAN